MTKDEVEAVAAELAKAGALIWHVRYECGHLNLVIFR
jgi:hypothetical protein